MDSFAKEDYRGMAHYMVEMDMTHTREQVNVDVLAQDLQSVMKNLGGR